MDRYRVDETGRVVTGWTFQTHLVQDDWNVGRSQMDSTFGESPDVRAIVDENGEERTYRRIAVVPDEGAA